MSFFLALILGLALTPVARRAGIAAGLVDRPSDPIKIHARPIPVLGGLAILLAAFAAAAIALGSVPPGLAIGVALALSVGLLDDVKSLPIGPRAVIQGAAGVIAATSLLDGTWPWAAAGVALLTLACANAVNMLDGQDGLAGVASAVSAASLAVVAILLGAGDDVSVVLAAVAGGCLAFLGWNRPPASIFLGDGGAYGLGVVFGWASVAITIGAGWQGLLAAGCCLLVPAYELVSTILRRLLGSGSLTAGDRGHSYDVLATRLGSRARSTAVIGVAAILSGGTGILVALVPGEMTAAVLSGAAVIGIVIGICVRGVHRPSPHPDAVDHVPDPPDSAHPDLA